MTDQPSTFEFTPDTKAKADEIIGRYPDGKQASAVMPLLIARATVQIVLWNQLSDAGPHKFPHGGLFDQHNKPKPTFNLMRDLRKSLS